MQFIDLRLIAVDVGAGVGLAYGGAQMVQFGLERGEREVIPFDGRLPPGLRDGRPHLLLQRAGGRAALVALRAGAAPSEVAELDWPDDAGTPLLRCHPADGRRCVVWSRESDILRVATLTDGGTGRLRRHDRVTGSIDVDARGVVHAPMADGSIVTLDPATGVVRTVARIDRPECTTRQVRLADDGYRVVLLCPDRFALGAVAAGAPYRELTASDGWISGLELLPGGDLLFTTMDWDPQVTLLDGI